MPFDASRAAAYQAAKNPAAPKGLRQTYERQASQQGQYERGASKIQPWAPKESQLEAAKQWYTGANSEGPENGWDTKFYSNAFQQYGEFQQKAFDSKSPSQFYDWLDPTKNKQATGVQTWGGDPMDQGLKDTGGSRRGDVYNNGKKVSNLYDDYDKATADVMLGEFMFSDDEKKNAWKSPVAGPDGKGVMDQEKYGKMVEEKAKVLTEQKLYGKTAEDFQDHVEQREKDLRSGIGDEAVVAAGAAAGAVSGGTAGAVLGSVVPVIGNVVGAVGGAIVGGIVGGVSSYLNQDQLVEMTARAQERTDVANEKFGDNWLQKNAVGLSEYSQLGMRALNPISNLNQGVQDARLGKVGDMTAEFYAVDQDGERKVGKVGTGIDIAASLVDGALQFASPVNAAMYMIGTGAMVTGKVGSLTTGSVWNDSRGDFDKIDTWQETVGAVGSVAIDAVQFGAAGAVTKAARGSRALFTGETSVAKASGKQGIFAAQDKSTFLTKVSDRAWGALPGKTFEKGAVGVERNGMRFMRDADSGKVLSVRPTISMIAPSEALKWVETGWAARKLARHDGGEMTRDHLLKAASDLTEQSAFRNAVLLGYTEGGEEFAQNVADTWSVSGQFDGGQAFESFLYGAAGGMGMGLGPNNRHANTTQQLQAQAYVQHSIRTGTKMPMEEWKAYTKNWSKDDYATVARTTGSENQNVKDIADTIAKQQRQDNARGSAIGYARLEAMNMSKFEKLSKKALEEGNGSLVIYGQTSEYLVAPDGSLERTKFAANSGVMTAFEAANQVNLIAKGHATQLETIKQELVDAQGRLAQAGVEGKPALQDVIQRKQAQINDLTAQVEVSKRMARNVQGLYERATKLTDTTEIRAAFQEMNELLSQAYAGKLFDEKGVEFPPEQQRLFQKAVEMKLARHPLQDKGSFALVVPQISYNLTRMNAHNTVYRQQGTLESMNADHDGDTVVPLHSVYLDDADLERLRRGDQYLQPTEDKDGNAVIKVVVGTPDGEWAFMKAFSDAMLDKTSWSATTVNTRLDGLINSIKAEFSATGRGTMDNTALTDILAAFKEGVQEGRIDARKNMVTKMANLDYEGFRNHVPEDGSPSVQWLWSRINDTWDLLQKDLAHVRSTESTAVPISPQREAAETTQRSEIARRDASTASGSLGLLVSDAVRGAQHTHYSALFRSLTQIPGGAKATMTSQQQLDLTQLFMELGSNQTAKDIELITGRNAIEERVYFWLAEMAKGEKGTRTVPETMLLLANVSVPNVEMGTTNSYQVTKGEITMLQLLLKRSLDIEQSRHRAVEPDSDMAMKIKTLRRLTKRDPDRSKHSNTASLAMLEVMGNRPLHELIGGGSSYISPNITLNQLVQQQRGLHPDVRNEEINRLIRSPGYIKDKGKTYGDAPWPTAVLSQSDPPINAFAMLVDAVKISGDTYIQKLRAQDETIEKKFQEGLAGVHQMMKAWRTRHAKDLDVRYDEVTDRVVLQHMLESDEYSADNRRLADELSKLIPDGAALGVFEQHEDGKVTASAWVEDMLVEKDLKRATAIYYWNVKLAEWNQKKGTVDPAVLKKKEKEWKDAVKEAKRTGGPAPDPIDIEDVRGLIDPGSLQSRFLHVLFHLSSQPDHVQLSRFMEAMNAAPSTKEMFDLINAEPDWRNNQAELMPWHDDVADFEVAPDDVWTGQMEGALQRENIRGWSQRMQVLGGVALEAEVNHSANRTLLNAMDQWLKTRNSDTKISAHDASMYVDLLEKAILNRKRFPDYQGQAARTQLAELQAFGLAAVQNKGKADAKAAPYGEPLITMDSFGFSDGLRQTVNSMTAEDVEDVMTNLTLLVDGPVRLNLPDGSEMEFDITTVEKALAMLMDPRTQGLAQTILFPTVRDVNKQNVVQHYVDTDAKGDNRGMGNIAKMLQEQTHKHLFTEHTEFNDRLVQAHRYIGHIEAYVRKDVHGNQDQDAQDKAFMPVQQMVGDFIAAYLHSKDVDPRNYTTTYNRLYIDVADAIKQVATVPESQRPKLRETIAATLERRFLKDSNWLDHLTSDDPNTESILALHEMEAEFDAYWQVIDEFDGQLARAADEDARTLVQAKKEEFVLQEQQKRTGNYSLEYAAPHASFLNAAAAKTMFEVTGNTPSSDKYAKTAIMTFMGRQDRIHSVLKKATYTLNKDTPDEVEVNAQMLYEKMLRIYDENPLDWDEVALEEWQVLGAWASEMYLLDTTARASSAVPATGAFLGENGAALQRYFDQSWLYLTDTLFDPKVLEAADLLSQGSAHDKLRNATEVGEFLTKGLLSDSKLGTWNRVVVNESMKASLVLKNSAVGAAVQMEGNDPKVMADYIGSNKVTYEEPEPGHFSVVPLTGSADQTLGELLTDSLAHVKLENHFVSEVIVQRQDPANPLDPTLADAFPSSTSVNYTSAATEAAGAINNGGTTLRVLDLQKLHDHIEWLKKQKPPLGDYTVTIKYVDVDKRPNERRWANNIFFDGVGREAKGGSGLGAIASLFFGLGGLNKVGQQNPLDMATKKGMGFKSHKRTDLDVVKNMELPGQRVAQILADKAMHLLDQDYPTGRLLRSDLPSLYKLMKMRHVVVGYNAEGRKEVWWPDRFIELEEAGKDIPLTDYKLVPLSDKVAQTLWGRSGSMGVKGTRGSLIRPTFNIQDLDIFPDLGAKKLKELGLDRLGETTEPAASRLAQVNALPKATSVYEKGKTYQARYIKQLQQWRGEMNKVNVKRTDKRKGGKGKFDVAKINEVNSQLIIDMMDAETMMVTAIQLGIPEHGLADLNALQVSRSIAAQVGKLMETQNSMVWVYKHTVGGDPTRGFLGRADIKENFAGHNGAGVTYGDVVAIDLNDIANSTASYEEAAQETARVIKAVGATGATISLQSRGQLDLRAAVAETLTNASMGYRAMSESGNFFLPITEEADYNAAQRASASTLLETSQYLTRNMALRIVADGLSTNLSEATEQIDLEHDRAAQVVSHTILPLRMLSTGSVGRRQPFAFNRPVRGEGRGDQVNQINAQLLMLLKGENGQPNREGRAFLKELLGGDDKDHPKHREHPNGMIELGVLPIDDALDKLQNQAETGVWPLDAGETFFWGTIVPTIGGDGSIHLSRIGFEQPDEKELKKQRDLRIHDKQVQFTGTTKKIDSKQTLPPPTKVDEIVDDVRGLSVRGTYAPGVMAKMISEGLGLKSGLAPMVPGYKFPDADIKAPGAAGMRVSRLMSATSVVGKEATDGMVNNFRDAFMVMGVNFEDDMIDYLFGEDPARSDETREQLWDLAHRALKEWAAFPHPYTASELSRMLDHRSGMAILEAQFNAIGTRLDPTIWKPVNMRADSANTLMSPKDRLGTIILTTLAAPGVQLEHVISTPGLTTVQSHEGESLVRRMPALMTNALNDPDYPEMRQMLIQRLNRNMPTKTYPDGSKKMLHWFDSQLKFHTRMTQEIDGKTREEEIVGFLQVHIPVPADENAIRLTYAGLDASGKESKHVADTIAGATGGELKRKARSKESQHLPDELDEIAGRNTIERFKDEESAAAALFYMFNQYSIDGETYVPWNRKTPMEVIGISKGKAKVKAYTKALVFEEGTSWTPSQVTQGKRLGREFLADELNITDAKSVVEVEYLIRQLFGIPGPAQDQEDYVEHLTFETYQTGIEYMRTNLKNGLHPLEGGMVPLEHEYFWKLVFDAQKNLPRGRKPWLPLSRDGKVKEYAKVGDWGAWVNTLHGQMRGSHESFNAAFRQDLDGFYRTYQGTHPDYMEMAISTDMQVTAKLLDKETNEPFMSVDPGAAAVMKDPIVLTSQHMTYDALVGQGTVVRKEDAPEISSSVLASRISAMQTWQKKGKLPKQKDLSFKEYAKQGASYQESTRKTTNFFRGVVNMSVMTRLFNPALFVSAMFEVPFRSGLEGFTNVLTGQMTGTRGRAVSGAAGWLEKGLNKGEDQWGWSKKLELDGISVQPRYSVDDINRMDSLNKSLGQSNRFLGMVYGELAYQGLVSPGQGHVGRALEWGAAQAARATADPRWGMKTSSLAKRYNDAAWEYLTMSGTSAKITLEQFTYEMMNDPEYLLKNDATAHRMGLNAVQQARGAKGTMLGNAIMNPIDRMTNSESLMVNGAGHLLKIPFLFTRFNANMLLTLTGLHGLDQTMAMMMDGRKRPKIIQSLMTRAKLNNGEESPPEYWDNSTIIGSIDLSRQFVTGAITQTGLMTAAMLAHGFSLGGEDEEERKRKRMALYLNTPYYHDPRKAMNDFRWTDAIFLDSIPVLNEYFKDETGHSAIVPHWIIRQFTSPVLGMMRFFETGDMHEIGHGFTDAATVMPNSVKGLYTDAFHTNQLIMEAAENDQLNPDKQLKIMQLMVNVVGVYERALIENQFISGMYQAKDQYDRNPWAIPQFSKTGDIVVEQGTRQPQGTEAMQARLKDDHVVASGMTRNGWDALLHKYAEGNATAALLMSIIPWAQGHDSDYLRYNMVTQKQKVQLDETPKEQVEALIYSAYLGQGGGDTYTKEELAYMIKDQEKAAGRYWKQDEVDAKADALYETLKNKPLTIFDKGGKEVLTQDGKEGIFRSLSKGVIKMDDPAIQGFHLTQAERDEIGKGLYDELVQEGVDFGLSDTNAKYRANRIWYGSKETGQTGMKWILYDKHIPDKPYAEYDQLNVTYVMGPDGKPWATPFARQTAAQVLGIPIPTRITPGIPGQTTLDSRGNVIDLVRGINTGLAAIVPRPLASDIKENDKAVKAAEKKTYTPGAGKGWRRFPRFGRRGFGGGGGGGGGGFGPNFTRIQPLPSGTSARIDDLQAINTSNPIIRRADVRRERISSERGRLKQWQ